MGGFFASIFLFPFVYAPFAEENAPEFRVLFALNAPGFGVKQALREAKKCKKRGVGAGFKPAQRMNMVAS